MVQHADAAVQEWDSVSVTELEQIIAQTEIVPRALTAESSVITQVAPCSLSHIKVDFAFAKETFTTPVRNFDQPTKVDPVPSFEGNRVECHQFLSLVCLSTVTNSEVDYVCNFGESQNTTTISPRAP